MNLVFLDYHYEKIKEDILIRVFKNQGASRREFQITLVILFSSHLGISHVHTTCEFPVMAVRKIVEVLNDLGPNNYTVQISNELEDNIGLLTNCRRGFSNHFRWRYLKHCNIAVRMSLK